MKHVTIALELLRKQQLYAKLAKRQTFMQSELKIMGHIAGPPGLQVDPKEVAIVQCRTGLFRLG